MKGYAKVMPISKSLIDDDQYPLDEKLMEEFSTKKKVVTSEESKILQQISEFDSNFSSNLELLTKLRILLVQCLQVCEGAYRSKPTQGNSYALTNMVTQVREITDRLEEAIDYDEVADKVSNEVVKPFIQKLILDLGTIIAQEVDGISSDKKREFVSKIINQIYKKYGAKIEVKIPTLQKKVVQNILKNVNQ